MSFYYHRVLELENEDDYSSQYIRHDQNADLCPQHFGQE
jgi:hypothetical protein